MRDEIPLLNQVTYADTAASGLLCKGLLEEVVLQREEHGTIVNIRGDDPLYAYLLEHGLVCSQRGGGIRLSLHLYNSQEDVARIMNVLESYPNMLPPSE